ncbi:MAG: hypothetical protein GXO46_13320 [Chlorobi bacterium]|nr:hypothetical protein [Chlorobiota bacterium]
MRKKIPLGILQRSLINSTGVGTLGRVAQVLWLNELTIVDSHVTIVRANSKKISKEILGFNLKLREKEIEELAEGSTGQTELSKKKLSNLKIVIADWQIQGLASSFFKTINGRSVNNWLELTKLASIRDTLLPKLISGQIRIKDAEKFVEEIL